MTVRCTSLIALLAFGCARSGFEGPISLSVGHHIRIEQSTTVRVRGGLGPVRFELVEGAGTLDPRTGVYTAPPSPTVAVIRATDANGYSATVQLPVWGLPGTADVTFALEAQATSTLLRQTVDLGFKGVLRVLNLLMHSRIKQKIANQTRSEFQVLKKLCEGGE